MDWTAPEVERRWPGFTAPERADLLRERIDGVTGL